MSAAVGITNNLACPEGSRFFPFSFHFGACGQCSPLRVGGIEHWLGEAIKREPQFLKPGLAQRHQDRLNVARLFVRVGNPRVSHDVSRNLRPA